VPLQAPVATGERLSDWIHRVAGPLADTTALHWRAQAQRGPQTLLQQAVLEGFRADAGLTLSRQERDEFQAWLLALPVTGRVTVALADERWLQGSPQADPVLGERQSVVLYPRPRHVAVLTVAAHVCLVPHRAGAHVADYLRACPGDLASTVDWAWIAQPDGRTRRFGVAAWNEQAQDQPAPGAWIWAPPHSARVPDSLSDNLAE